MSDRMARVKQLKIEKGRRILVISDVHANLLYLKGLLEKASFCDDDVLIFDGDFLEKGAHSLEMLRYIMELSKRGNVHAVCGNCDEWEDIPNANEKLCNMVMNYMMTRKCGLIWDMCNASGLDPFEIESMEEVKEVLRRAFKPEFEFLRNLPHVIETENFIFAHAAVDPEKPLREHKMRELATYNAFLKSGRSFDKWVVVGHWPVMLYVEDRVCANPIIDREHKIISIDGGCVLKDDGQLNALVIPNKDSEDFSWISYDPFPTRRVLTAQAESEKSYYIRWGDSEVKVLERGEEFSRCRHLRTGYEMDILTKYLFTDGEITDCNDCTDYVPALRPGDIVSVVEETSRGYFVKHNGCSGWYFGELE